ncbi:MAG: DMT family transporter [Chloroflexota bacterium]
MLGALGRAWKDPSPFFARMLLLAGAGFWSLGGFFIKDIDAGAMSIVFFRCLFSALILIPFIRGRKFPGALDSGVSIAFFALLLVMYVASTKETTAANAIFLQYTAPIYVAILGPFVLRERLRSRELLPFAVCVGGIAVLFLGNSGAGETKGLALGAGSGLFYGLFFIWLRRLRDADAIAITVVNCLGVAVILAAVPSVWDVGLTDIGLLSVMAVIQFALPYVLFTRGIAYVPGAEASLIALIEPVLNPVWVAIFYGENPSAATIIGGAIIISGLAVRYGLFREPARVEAGAAAELAGGPAALE